jgi:hypothetical protein
MSSSGPIFSQHRLSFCLIPAVYDEAVAPPKSPGRARSQSMWVQAGQTNEPCEAVESWLPPWHRSSPMLRAHCRLANWDHKLSIFPSRISIGDIYPLAAPHGGWFFMTFRFAMLLLPTPKVFSGASAPAMRKRGEFRTCPSIICFSV